MDGGEPEPPPSGPDPCGLITRSEAEAVLGQLVVEPYRSNEGTPLADPYGKGCSYLTAGHRALVLRPHWEGGKMLFGMARNLGGTVASALPEAGPDHESADTLDGPWDEAAGNGTTGDLYFLKGDRMLEVGYLTSSTGPAGAVRLARIAVDISMRLRTRRLPPIGTLSVLVSLLAPSRGAAQDTVSRIPLVPGLTRRFTSRRGTAKTSSRLGLSTPPECATPGACSK